MSGGTPNQDETPQQDVPVLRTPAEGVPSIVDAPASLAAAVAALQAGHGPVAVDTERAQGFRYSAKAYLVQLRRTGAGTHLVDPQAFEPPTGVADLSELRLAIADAEWIIHAATQDLPSLAEVGLIPERIFDTELAGRLLGLPRVGLATMVEEFLGVRLLKEHSASDWSIRPVPVDMASYAALDVELLEPLRDALDARLEQAGRRQWAAQEFAHMVHEARRPRPADTERWRRLSGAHRIRTPLGLALLRELWTTRDRLAATLDRAPGRVLPDAAIVELAGLVKPGPSGYPTATAMSQIAGFDHRLARRHSPEWAATLDRVRSMDPSMWPPTRVPQQAPPHPRSWQRASPPAYARWIRVRPAINVLADHLGLAAENLLSPRVLRLIAWQPPAELSEQAVDRALADAGARQWQRELVTAVLVRELRGATG